MNLRFPPPAGRTPESLYKHYTIEKAIATRLKETDTEGRKLIYRDMYDELFARVPDHPRLTQREDNSTVRMRNLSKLKLVTRWLQQDKTLVEFGPGDCRFSFMLTQMVARVYGIDISDQSGKLEKPHGFQLIVYDGYELDLPDQEADIVFSDQLIEHFHPDDLVTHFELAFRLLTDDGVYVFRTPNALMGPHDISRYFSDTPDCFHLKEWTYAELKEVLARVGFKNFSGLWLVNGRYFQLPCRFFVAVESMAKIMPQKWVRRVSQYFPFLFNIVMVARKP